MKVSLVSITKGCGRKPFCRNQSAAETTLATNNYLSFFFSDALEPGVFALAEVTATELRIVAFPAVPLPASAVLLLAGLGGMAVAGRRKPV